MSAAANPDRYELNDATPVVAATPIADKTVTTKVQVSATPLPCRFVLLSSLASNTTRVRWAVSSSVAAGIGSPIEPGTTVQIPVADASAIYMIAESGSPVVAIQVVIE